MRTRLAIIAVLLLGTVAVAQIDPATQLIYPDPGTSPGAVGGISAEVCNTFAVTTGSAYTAGNVVGPTAAGAGTLTFANVVRRARTGILQSAKLNFGDTQTAEFDLTGFFSAPATTFTDKTAPAISAADALLMQGPIKFTDNQTLLGANGTVYQNDAIARATRFNLTTANFVLTTKGTPTFTNGTPKICLYFLQD